MTWKSPTSAWSRLKPWGAGDPPGYQPPGLRLQLRCTRAPPGSPVVGRLPLAARSGRPPLGGMLGYFRLTTSPGVLPDPFRPEVVLSHLRSWLARPQVRILEPGRRHLDLLTALTKEAGAAGRLTTDLHLAALAIEHDAELHSNDSDFGLFSSLRWVNPLK
ncbi:MAG TPA: TA system VapC family ribonuclease toxin [Thermoanaerobaculia bacterium]|nr:TA system VapC family ribonuclease toxin [Thermoanaerobaculia bacterium]